VALPDADPAEGSAAPTTDPWPAARAGPRPGRSGRVGEPASDTRPPAEAVVDEAAPVWPRRRATSTALIALVVLQALLFFAVTQRSFFATDDFFHFKLAQERHLLRYLATPILGVYPAPGHRLATLVLHELFPLGYTAARIFLLGALAGTTILLGQLVRTLARSDDWWTVALLAPFALSLTLLSPVWWWSNGLPVIPLLFFTTVALSAWLRSYTDPRGRLWLGVAVIAVAASGAFYIKFLLIPVYLLFIRLAIIPQLLDLPGGVRHLWQERMRWIALAAPPAAFLAVYVLAGLAARSAVPGERPYLEYLATAWFHALIPVSFLNARLDGWDPSLTSWAIIVASQALFWIVVGATWKRSPLALRAWALFVFVFVVNAGMVGAARLPGFGVQIAYELRYYPEIVFFLPLTLALGLRQGGERHPDVAWERTRWGRTAIGLLACLYAVSFVVWAPRIMSDAQGVLAKAWFDNLRPRLHALADDEPVLRIVDSETPEYVMPAWMAPHNRISTILALMHLDVVYNEWSEPTYLVLDDGRLAEAEFQPISLLLSGTTPGEGVQIVGQEAARSAGTCLREGGQVLYSPDADITGERLALRVSYSARSHQPVGVGVETYDPDRPFRRLELRAFEGDVELLDLNTPRLRELTLEPGSGGVCIERLEMGSLTPAGP
jgi:hypothetical protein